MYEERIKKRTMEQDIRISVIIPHFRGESYLKDALYSIKCQEYPFTEVILVLDGCKEDLSEIIGMYPELDIKVFKTNAKKGSPKGVANARNIGLENATGDYVFFLDSDDYLSDGYFEALLAMAETYPDAMIRTKKIKTYFKRDGQLLREAEKKALLEQQADGDDDPDEEEDNPEAGGEEEDDPETETGTLVEKNKFGSATVLGLFIPRRFIDAKFDESYKYYSDLPFMCKICRNAPIVTCKGIKYYKRTHNDAVRMPQLLQEEAKGKSEEFIRSFKEGWETASKGPLFTPNITSKYATLIENFNPNLSYMENYLIAYVLRKLTKGKHPVGLQKWTDEEMGRFTPFLAEIPKVKLKKYNFFKRRIINKLAAGNIKGVRKTANFYSMKKKKKGLLGSPLQWKWNIYKRIFRKMSVKKEIVFIESFLGRSYSDSCKYLYEYMLKLQEEGRLGTETRIPQNAKFVWMIHNKGAKIPGRHKEVKQHSLRYFYYVARCSVWITNMRQPTWYVKRDGVTLLECWHGTPLKRLVFDMEDVYSVSPKYKMTVYNQSRLWDYLLSDNRFSTECFKSCFLYPEEKILELGYPRNDLLYGADRNERAIKIKEKLGIPLDKKIVLYAPTWRDDDYYGPGQYKFELPLDLEMMKQLKNEYFFVLRTHYFIADHLNISAEDADFVSDQSRYNDIGELYLISDILITDYSSVFFDFANLRRPILFYVYDLEKYAGILRGFYFDMTTGCPGPLLKTNEEILDALRNIGAIEAEYADKYRDFCNKFCYLDDGHASERVVKTIFGL